VAEEPLSFEQVAALALAGGFPPGPAVIATAITTCESSRIQDAIQPDQPYDTTGWGLWQITPGDSEPQFGINNALLDGLNNARAAYAKYTGAGGFSPWTTYGNSCYAQYLPQAEAAVGQAASLSPAQLARLVADIRPGAAGAAGTITSADDWAAQVRQSTVHMATWTVAKAASDTALTRARTRFTTPRVVIADPATTLIIPRRIRG
jgi:hypothetical protein